MGWGDALLSSGLPLVPVLSFANLLLSYASRVLPFGIYGCLWKLLRAIESFCKASRRSIKRQALYVLIGQEKLPLLVDVSFLRTGVRRWRL